MLCCFQGEGAPELCRCAASACASGHLSTCFAFWVREHPKLCRCEWSLEHIFVFWVREHPNSQVSGPLFCLNKGKGTPDGSMRFWFCQKILEDGVLRDDA